MRCTSESQHSGTRRDIHSLDNCSVPRLLDNAQQRNYFWEVFSVGAAPCIYQGLQAS
jgi:hypothetical protein